MVPLPVPLVSATNCLSVCAERMECLRRLQDDDPETAPYALTEAVVRNWKIKNVLSLFSVATSYFKLNCSL